MTGKLIINETYIDLDFADSAYLESLLAQPDIAAEFVKAIQDKAAEIIERALPPLDIDWESVDWNALERKSTRQNNDNEINDLIGIIDGAAIELRAHAEEEAARVAKPQTPMP